MAIVIIGMQILTLCEVQVFGEEADRSAGWTMIASHASVCLVTGLLVEL